jgi:hypothetical protein
MFTTLSTAAIPAADPRRNLADREIVTTASNGSGESQVWLGRRPGTLLALNAFLSPCGNLRAHA